MICLETVKKYCKEYWKVENYQEAMNDQTLTWHCHHIHEIDWALPAEELIAIGRYYDVHYSELVFLTPEEHHRLHRVGENNPMYGKEGVNAPNYKYHITEEELYDLYIVKGLNQYQIADIFRCSQSCIHLKLKKFNIKK